jgi:hypothetical protein
VVEAGGSSSRRWDGIRSDCSHNVMKGETVEYEV